MFDQTQIRLRKRTLDTNDCYFRRLFLIEIISIDRLMAGGKWFEGDNKNKRIYILQIKNFFIYGVNRLAQIKYKVRIFTN